MAFVVAAGERVAIMDLPEDLGFTMGADSGYPYNASLTHADGRWVGDDQRAVPVRQFLWRDRSVPPALGKRKVAGKGAVLVQQ